MTLRESLEITIRMWDYIADMGLTEKSTAVQELNLPKMLHNCACCQYVGEHYPDQVKYSFDMQCGQPNAGEVRCPLAALWPDGCELPSGMNTAWTRWSNEHDPSDAREIANAARDALAKISAQSAGHAVTPTPQADKPTTTGDIASPQNETKP